MKRYIKSNFNYSGHIVPTSQFVVTYLVERGDAESGILKPAKYMELVSAPDDYAAKVLVEKMLNGAGAVIDVHEASDKEISEFYDEIDQNQKNSDLPF